MKAYLITPNEATVTEIDYNGDWRTIKELLHCDLFTTVQLNAAGDTVFVDDEGLINDNPHGWFILSTYGQPLKGYGLVLGCNDQGESIEPFVSLEDFKAMVSFPKHVNEAMLDRRIHVTPL